MELLAIQTANAPLSVAWISGGAVRASEIFQGTAEKACDAVAEFVQRFGRADGIMVSSGPGGWTGTRTGFALAEGLRLGWKCPILGVNAFESLSFAARRVCSGSILCVVDSKRDSLFWQLRDTEGTEHTPIFCDPPEGILQFASGRRALRWVGFCPPPFRGQDFALERPARADEMALAGLERAPKISHWPERVELLYERPSLSASASAPSNFATESATVAQLATNRARLGSLP